MSSWWLVLNGALVVLGVNLLVVGVSAAYREMKEFNRRE